MIHFSSQTIRHNKSPPQSHLALRKYSPTKSYQLCYLKATTVGLSIATTYGNVQNFVWLPWQSFKSWTLISWGPFVTIIRLLGGILNYWCITIGWRLGLLPIWAIRIVSADGLASLGARTSSDTMMACNLAFHKPITYDQSDHQRTAQISKYLFFWNPNTSSFSAKDLRYHLPCWKILFLACVQQWHQGRGFSLSGWGVGMGYDNQ